MEPSPKYKLSSNDYIDPEFWNDRNVETVIDGINDSSTSKKIDGSKIDVDFGDLGLDQVDNTSDADKPISTDTQAALDLKAPLASPALTGSPTAPTAPVDTNTTQVATTAFAKKEADDAQAAAATDATTKANAAQAFSIQRSNHTGTQAPSTIAQNANNRFVTDVEKQTWNAKQENLAYTPENASNKRASFQTTPTHTAYPSEKLVKDSLDLKVNAVSGKQLSTNDYTTAEKNKLAGIPAGADVTPFAIAEALTKTTPVDADTIPFLDSEASNALKRGSWANVKAALKAYFDTLYDENVNADWDATSGDAEILNKPDLSVIDGGTL
jgi:hypothetical protein